MFRYTEICLLTIEKWSGILSAPSKENSKLVSIPIFENQFIEKHLAQAHPIFPGLWAIPCILFSLWVAPRDLYLGLFLVLGILFWSLFEYLLHKFIFHMDTDTPEKKFSVFMMHGYHHEFPNDKRRLVAPALLSWPLAAIVGLFWYLVGGPYWTAGFAGTVLGYLAYDWLHYYTHHFKPRTRLGKYLRRYHMEHHFKDSKSHYGITSPLWDILLD